MPHPHHTRAAHLSTLPKLDESEYPDLSQLGFGKYEHLRCSDSRALIRSKVFAFVADICQQALPVWQGRNLDDRDEDGDLDLPVMKVSLTIAPDGASASTTACCLTNALSVFAEALDEQGYTLLTAIPKVWERAEDEDDIDSPHRGYETHILPHDYAEALLSHVSMGIWKGPPARSPLADMLARMRG